MKTPSTIATVPLALFFLAAATGCVRERGASVENGGWGSEAPFHFTDAEKLITWDKVNLSITKNTGDSPGNDCPDQTDLDNNIDFSNFEFTVSNNIEAVYGLGQNNLLPYDIVPGLRHISGTLSAFNAPGFDGVDQFEDYCTGNEHTLTVSIASGCISRNSNISMKVRFHRLEPTLNTGVIMSTVGFTGVTHQSGAPWDPS